MGEAKDLSGMQLRERLQIRTQRCWCQAARRRRTGCCNVLPKPKEARKAAHLHGVLVLPGLLAHEELPQDDTKAVHIALLVVALRSA